MPGLVRGEGGRLAEGEGFEPPATRIGVEVGPDRAGAGPIVPNEAWEPVEHGAPRWCVRPGGIIPRFHRIEHFLIFDPGLPAYRRCPRCGSTVYLGWGHG